MRTSAHFDTPRPRTRRAFLREMSAVTGAALFAPSVTCDAAEVDPSLRAAIIGHTGHGDYGHGLEAAFDGVPGVRVVAIADPDASGRARALARSGADRSYADYREMLRAQRPDLVVVAPRWSDEHRDMALAAIESGAHVLLEKPIAPTLAQADEIVAAADKARRKIAVCHQMRLSPAIVHLRRRISEGLLGELLQMNAFGKQDSRAGGEDMLVLGVHLFDLMRLFAGEPLWCTARILQDGRDITPADSHPVREAIGPVAGNEVFAQYAFNHGVNATFASRAALREHTGHWGMELVGSTGTARIVADIWPTVYVLDASSWDAGPRTDTWRRLPDDPTLGATAADRADGPANRRVVEDWIAAIRAGHEPACNGRDATKALEMVMAAYNAALSGARVRFPLADRRHPLGKRA